LQRQACAGADAIEEGAGGAVAAEEQVLPVVDGVAGGLVDDRVGAPAELRPPLEQRDARALVGEAHRGGQPGEAAADDDHVLHRLA
jgi:hypothetical protein